MHPDLYKPKPNAIVIEPTAGPWKNNISWGDKFEGPMPATAGTEQELVDGKEIVGPPRVQSIALIRRVQQTGSNSDFRARIFYTIGAAKAQFECDFADGVQFSLVANWVRVTLVSFTPNPINPYDASGGRVAVQAGIAEGTVVQGAPLYFTEAKLVEGGGAAGVFESPPFAKRVCVWGGKSTQTVDFIGPGSLNPFSGTIADFVTYRESGMALPLVERVVVAADAVDQTVVVQWFLGL